MTVRDAAAWLNLGVGVVLAILTAFYNSKGAEIGLGIMCAVAFIIVTFVPEHWRLGDRRIDITDEEE
jgi:hypothetical protein